MFDWFHKTTPKKIVLLVNILHHEKKHVISTPALLEFTFPREDVID